MVNDNLQGEGHDLLRYCRSSPVQSKVPDALANNSDVGRSSFVIWKHTSKLNQSLKLRGSSCAAQMVGERGRGVSSWLQSPVELGREFCKGEVDMVPKVKDMCLQLLSQACGLFTRRSALNAHSQIPNLI